MNREESIKLLALIKVAYPTAYKDMDKETKLATVSMWQSTFPSVPYAVMEMAFNRFRMASKFPPTVAEMAEELSNVYYQALEESFNYKALGDEERVKLYSGIMRVTEAYKNGSYKDAPVTNLKGLLASESFAGVLSEGQHS